MKQAIHENQTNKQKAKPLIRCELLSVSDPLWLAAVLDDFDTFLLDHAACEKKAAGMAISMISHYPDRQLLVTSMCDIAVEEMVHFREVVKIIQARGLQLVKDEKDPYIQQLQKLVRKGSEEYFLDRLIMGAVVEARGAERFALIAQSLKTQSSQIYKFYVSLAQSEARHFENFIDLASYYFMPSLEDTTRQEPDTKLQTRVDQWLEHEAEVINQLAFRAALH